MGINWSEKNTVDLELYFSTDVKKGLTQEQYLQSKAQYGENIIDSSVLEQQNFYGLKKKKRNIKAMLSGSVGIMGVLYFLTLVMLKVMGFDVKIYVFLAFYAFLAVSAFILSGDSEKKYEYLYKAARPKALVIRQNKRKKVFIENIVPGDVIQLSAGDIVPADARLVSADYLSCIHINKNGQIERVAKTSEIIARNGGTDMPANIIYAADIIDHGSASAVVIATGEKTYISGLSEENGINISSRDVNINISGNTPEPQESYSFMQKHAGKMSRNFFLASIGLSMLIMFSGILQGRDFLAVIMTALTASASCFSEQLPIIADFAVMQGMYRLSKLGILVKKASIIDDINEIDTVVAKKTESFTQDKMQLKKISGPDGTFDAAIKNSSETGYILSCMTMCSNVAENDGRNGENKYTGSAVDVAVFEALDKCGLNHDAVNQVYQKIGKIVYNPKSGTKSAVIVKDGKLNLLCFGEAFNILERCAPGRIQNFHRDKRHQVEDLYKEYDLVMAVAIKDFDYINAEIIGFEAQAELESEGNLDFIGFASFSEPKTSAVFESIDYLKKSGVSPVMIADSDNAHTRNAAVKFGIAEDFASAKIISDAKIARMGDSMFYIDADKYKLFTPISLENKKKFLKALKFRKKIPAITVNDVVEISLMDEPCVTFTSVNTETGILKNKASVITKNLTVSTILKTVKNCVLIYRNISKIVYFASVMFISQYLLILLAVLLNGAYILTPVQIIWAGIGAGYIFAAAICFSEENRQWHDLRHKIKEYKNPKKFDKSVLQYGIKYGLLIFAFTSISFFTGIVLKSPASPGNIITEYINLNSANNAAIKSAQTAGFITYTVSCASLALSYIKSPRLFDFKLLKNKVFTIAFVLNIAALLCAVFVPAVRDFLDFGEVKINIAVFSAALGLWPAVISGFARKGR